MEKNTVIIRNLFVTNLEQEKYCPVKYDGFCEKVNKVRLSPR